MKHYVPEVGQALFGCPTGPYDAGYLGEACVTKILEEIDRVYWNVNQKNWDKDGDPKIPGLEFRPYYWGEDEEEMAKPNLAVAGVEVRWYKHHRRGLTFNVPLDPVAMDRWLNEALAVIHAADWRHP